jgi:hypothetical protein
MNKRTFVLYDLACAIESEWGRILQLIETQATVRIRVEGTFFSVNLSRLKQPRGIWQLTSSGSRELMSGIQRAAEDGASEATAILAKHEHLLKLKAWFEEEIIELAKIPGIQLLPSLEEAWLDVFTKRLSQPTDKEIAFFELRNILELGVELNPEDGQPHDQNITSQEGGSRVLAVAHRAEIFTDIGQFLTGEEAALLLNDTAMELDAMAASGHLLRLETDTGWRYPELQFQEGKVTPEMQRFLKFHAKDSAWFVLDTLIAPDHRFGGETMLEVIHAKDIEALDLYFRQETGDGYS